MKKPKHIGVCIDEELLKRFHYIAWYDDRSARGQIMYSMNKSTRDFEEKHGEIVLTDLENMIK